MKKIFSKFVAALLTVTLLATGFGCVPAKAADASGMKAVWVSFYDFETYLKGLNQSSFDSTFTAMCQKIAAQGCNTVVVHVRSHNDAVYPSSIYPWSTEMLNGNPGYDPLADMVSIAHANGLKFHAWINPYGYRGGGKFGGNIALVTNDNVVAGVKEIVANYNVDGIHFDDIFPPTYGSAIINPMIKACHDTCAAYGKVFGISPAGNIDNNRANGVDIDTWLSTPGYVDYIVPQLYWSDNFSKSGTVTMYSTRLAAWKSLNKIGIPMYAGLALYKTGSLISTDPGWAMKQTNLLEQANKAYASGYSGYFLFRYNSLSSSNPATVLELQNLKSAQ